MITFLKLDSVLEIKFIVLPNVCAEDDENVSNSESDKFLHEWQEVPEYTAISVE